MCLVVLRSRVVEVKIKLFATVLQPENRHTFVYMCHVVQYILNLHKNTFFIIVFIHACKRVGFYCVVWIYLE